MNTTLDPKPTDREREMLAEWAGRFATMQFPSGKPMYTNTQVMDDAESLLHEFRARYGVTGAEHICQYCGVSTNQPDAECYKAPQPIREEDITLKEVCDMLRKYNNGHDRITFYEDGSGYMMNVHDAEHPDFNSLPELIAILKGGKSE